MTGGQKKFIFREGLPYEGGEGNFVGGGSYPSAYYEFVFSSVSNCIPLACNSC